MLDSPYTNDNLHVGFTIRDIYYFSPSIQDMHSLSSKLEVKNNTHHIQCYFRSLLDNQFSGKRRWMLKKYSLRLTYEGIMAPEYSGRIKAVPSANVATQVGTS